MTFSSSNTNRALQHFLLCPCPTEPRMQQHLPLWRRSSNHDREVTHFFHCYRNKRDFSFFLKPDRYSQPFPRYSKNNQETLAVKN